MVRAFKYIAMILVVLVAESALSKSAECVRAYAAIEEKIIEYRLRPPSEPLRFLTDEEVTLTRLNGGKSFQYEYDNGSGVVQYWGPGHATGFELAFKNSQGKIHKIQIIGKSTRLGQIEAVTDMVRKLPAETLEATDKIEVQTFVRNTGMNGYAKAKNFVLLEDGANLRTFTHEFGHNLAHYIWGRMNPYKEWERAFKLDDAKFVTPYAKSKFEVTKYAEDFAEAVAAYLHDAPRFRMQSPNRAALLDTIFRDADLWKPIRDRNQTLFAQIARTAEEHPVGTVGAILIGGGGFAGGTAAIVNIVQNPSSLSFKPQPTPPENPR